MAPKLTVEYDRIGDILYITRVPPYPGQESEELENSIIVRLNPETNEVEGLEILFWSKRLEAGKPLDLPVVGAPLAV
jgi:uncharacterized protein YuzE